MADYHDSARNLLLIPDNRLDDRGDGQPATLSGGAWRAERPLTNLLDRRLAVTAESDGLDPAATRLVIDYGAATDLRALALIASTVSRTGQIRHTIGNDPAGLDVEYDSGWQDYHPTVRNPWRLPRAHPSFGHGKLSERELRGYQLPWHSVAPEPILARYEHLSVNDPDNRDGYIRLARLFTGSGWQTSVPVDWACKFDWDDQTKLSTTLAGGTDADVRKPARTMDVQITGLPEDEAMGQLYDLIGRSGLSGQMYVSFDPTETVHRHRRSMLARMRQMSPVELAHHDWAEAGLRFIEEVA